MKELLDILDMLGNNWSLWTAIKNISIIAVLIAVPMETYKWFKDAYWFSTWNYNRQWKCRQSLRIMFAMRAELFTIMVVGEDYRSDHRERCRKLLDLAFELSDTHYYSGETYDDKFIQMCQVISNSGLNDVIEGYNPKATGSLYYAYGYQR